LRPADLPVGVSRLNAAGRTRPPPRQPLDNKEHFVDSILASAGGAGTYSDGKLYTRATKHPATCSILRLLVQHGATPDILVDAHPHWHQQTAARRGGALRDSVRRAEAGAVETRVDDLLVTEGNRACAGGDGRRSGANVMP
jgi:hypothetical protein